MPNRPGFTLIELLVVVIVVGIVAAIAIPRYRAPLVTARYAAMRADLRDLHLRQHLYREATATIHAGARYAASLDDRVLDFTASPGVTVHLTATPDRRGWSATATHADFRDNPARSCAIFIGIAN